MYYAQMRKFDVANGTGIRTTLFVSGCRHNCEGCFSETYQDFEYGERWTKAAEDQFLSYAQNSNVHGVTILGGEPMQQTMDSDLLYLLRRIKAETDHNIWIYSGYTFDQIIKDPKKLELLTYCDVLVDGPFIVSQKDITLRFRGSQNQRIIDVKTSLIRKEVTLLEDF